MVEDNEDGPAVPSGGESFQSMSFMSFHSVLEAVEVSGDNKESKRAMIFPRTTTEDHAEMARVPQAGQQSDTG